MSFLFCIIMFYRIFLVSAAALRSTTVGSEPTSTGRCEPVGTEQMSTGHLVVFASLRSVQSGHPPDVLHPCIFPYQSFKLPMKGTELDYGMCKMCLYRKQMEEL